MAEEIAPQADFNIIATEVLKIANTPALAGGQQLLAELRAIRQQSTTDTTAIRQDIAAIRQDIANVRQEVVDVRQGLTTVITASYV